MRIYHYHGCFLFLIVPHFNAKIENITHMLSLVSRILMARKMMTPYTILVPDCLAKVQTDGLQIQSRYMAQPISLH